MFNEEIRIKQTLSYMFKDSLQEQIHFNGNIFGNKCCHFIEGLLYSVTSMSQTLILLCLITVADSNLFLSP